MRVDISMDVPLRNHHRIHGLLRGAKSNTASELHTEEADITEVTEVADITVVADFVEAGFVAAASVRGGAMEF